LTTVAIASQRLPQALLVSNQANRERLGIAQGSFRLWRAGVAIVTGSGERDGWLMAVGIDMGFVALELALLVAPAAATPAVARMPPPRSLGPWLPRRP